MSKRQQVVTLCITFRNKLIEFNWLIHLHKILVDLRQECLLNTSG